MPPYRKRKQSINLALLRVIGLIICYCLLLSLPSQSQSISSYSSLAEKIYLQLDNKAYTTDQTIWFKAIATDAADHIPSKASGVLYAELIDPSENIVERKLIKLEQGIGNGFFQLTPNYTYGYYQVRAYTEWDKNFGPGFFFKEYVLVSGPEGKQETNLIKNLTVIEGQNNERRLNVNLDPVAADSISGKGITVFLTLDEKKDTLSIKKNKSNQYLLDYTVPSNCQVVTLQIESDNSLNYSKTIVLDTSYLDFQLFPESGELVQGLPGLLGFKALGYNGKGLQVEGEITNEKGRVIASFKTNQLGMGWVKLETIDSAEKYTARILSRYGVRSQKIYSLPAIAAKGNILSVKKEEDKIHLKASSNYLVTDSIVVQASCRGVIYYDFKGRLKNGILEFSAPANTLPEGIIDFTLLIDSKPVAERLYFNERPETRINISVSSDKEKYVQREETKLTIETKDNDGQSVPANLSLLVFNKSQQGSMLDFRQNILSYFLLSSDLKGEIENPGFYFAKDADRFNDLDALLLTQGWRKYNYTRDPVTFRFQPEPYLAVSGNAKGGLSNNKIIRDADLTMMTFGKDRSIAKQKTDSLGRFSFSLNNEYGQDLKILIRSANKSDKQKDYLITLDKKESPPVLFDHIKSVEKPDSTVKKYLKKSIEDKKTEDAFKDSTEGRTLDEVTVKSYLISPEKKMVTDKYGQAKTVIDGKDIRAKEAKWSYGLYSVLLFNFRDKVNIVTGWDGNLYARLYNGDPTLVVVDGITVKIDDYASISSIPPSEVKSFEIIEHAKSFSNLYCEVFPGSCSNAPAWGNVIAIYTYAGKGLLGVHRTVGVSQMAIPVFAPPREFYAPKYNDLKPTNWLKPDLRNLVHWEPKIKTDSTGKASISFYNSDNTGRTQVVVEAISENGEIGYQELFFDVGKRE